MKFGDYSPPAVPMLDQQHDALQKGLGRALQWALNQRLDDEPLLEACLRDQRFDVQFDSLRGDWLWRIIRAVGGTERFRVPILHAFYELSDECSAGQLCELARCYAELGDETFRTRLYKVVEQKPFADIPWLGEQEIVALDGEQAFLLAARMRGRSLAIREWEWHDESLVYLAVERLSEEQVTALLESSSDEAVRLFWKGSQEAKQRESEQPRLRERMLAISVQEVVRAAESDSKSMLFRAWGRCADEANLKVVLERLWAEQEPRTIANLLQVFSARALPEFDARLMELCRHSDEVRRRAFIALKQNAHPLVRQFALSELQTVGRHRLAVALFINNYLPGDEHRILEALEFPDDAYELHWLLMDVINVLEKNAEADCYELGVISYASTPCETCRAGAARLLLNRQVAPEWLKEECRHDSGEECRELVAKTSSSELFHRD